MKKCITFSLALLFCCLFTTCFGPWQGNEGTIVIDLGGGGNGRDLGGYSTAPNLKELKFRIDLYRDINFASKEDMPDKTEWLNGAVRAAIPVTPGKWYIQVTAYWSKPVHWESFIYARSMDYYDGYGFEAEIAAGTSTSVSIKMESEESWPKLGWKTISMLSQLELILPDDPNSPGDNKFPLDGNYLLIKDISIDREWTPIGEDVVNSSFTGEFDGNGHTISFKEPVIPANTNLGLFGHLGGEVRNLKLDGEIILDYAGSSPPPNIGAVAGINNGSISNVSSSVFINVKGANSANVGGLVGLNGTGTIKNCYATNNDKNNGVSGGNFVGGLVGLNRSGTIRNCYATNSIEGTENVGGLVGSNENGSFIENCVAWNEKVNGSGTNTGRVMGLDNSSSFSHIYALENMAGGPFNNAIGTFVMEADLIRMGWWADILTISWTINSKAEADEDSPWWWNGRLKPPRPILWFED